MQNTRPCICNRILVACCTFFALSILIMPLQTHALTVPGYGDPNQPYDKLPGTLETYHVRWLKPLPGEKLRVLFIIPYSISREVVELAQRLDLEYSYIMNSGKTVWSEGRYVHGPVSTPIPANEAAAVLDNIVKERLLDHTKEYDVIIIAGISWEVIPNEAKDEILQRVEAGTGLVYVSPNRLKKGLGSQEETPGEDPQFNQLFRTNQFPEVTGALMDSVPLDIMPLKVLMNREEMKNLVPLPRIEGIPAIQPLYMTATKKGEGRIVTLDYFSGALAPEIVYDEVMYDYFFALLSRSVLWTAKRETGYTVEVSMDSKGTGLAEPVYKNSMGLEFKTPAKVIARSNIPDSKAIIRVTSAGKSADNLKLDCNIRDSEGKAVMQDTLTAVMAGNKETANELPVPLLPRGTYVMDIRILDGKNNVLGFTSRSFRVEDSLRVARIETDHEKYNKGDKIEGRVTFAQPLSSGQNATVRAVDTWNRIVFRTPVNLAEDRITGTFTIPVELPLCRLWDIYCTVSDEGGEVDTLKKWVGLPDWTFDEYMWPLIFSPAPGYDWRGQLYSKVIRPYGINANNVQLIYHRTYQYELDERFHLQSISDTQHMGQLGAWRDKGAPDGKEFSEACLSELSRMARYIADTGNPLDPKEYPYVAYQPWSFDANWINGRFNLYRESTKFGSPYYYLTGEEYLAGEFDGREVSCFCPLCTKNFQNWCKEQFKGDLNALNAEWGSDFKSWDDVRGILLKDAAEKNQLPRWVDFRYFMRSRVWSQFFIDWTDMMRRIMDYPVRTGYNGHDHHDLSRYRDHMTSGKMYVSAECGGGPGYEWKLVAAEELHQSFSGDNSFLLGANAIVWNSDFEIPIERKRLPWKMLFAGFRGFDWERGGGIEALGGEMCFTPDYSEPLPFFKDISDEVLYLQRGIGKLANTSKPYRVPIAYLWSLPNHYISRLMFNKGGNLFIPREGDSFFIPKSGFSGSWLYNITYDGGAVTDAVALMKSLRMRATFVAPEDVISGALKNRGFKALILPYNKGMSEDEARAIRDFVREGGLVIADNDPATYSEHGRKLEKPRLADLFPVTDRDNVVEFGKGAAAYLPNGINFYLSRMEKGNYAGSEIIASLLKKYAGVTTPVEMIDSNGKPRRDVLMPVYIKGSARYVGMVRHSLSEGNSPDETTVILDKKYHVWEAREPKYYGYVDTFNMNMDMYPKFFALLPANPVEVKLVPNKPVVKQSEVMMISGEMVLAGGTPEEIANMAQVVHVEVTGPDGKELEWYRNNLLFEGKDFKISLPVSYSEIPGEYTVKVEYPTTGMKAETKFRVQ